MIALLSPASDTAPAVLAAIAAAGFCLTIHVNTRWERRKRLMARYADPYRRSGARN